jgi:hypothetical protein
MIDSKEALLSWLDGQREHVLGILEGLSEEELRRAVLPSGWSSLGLVKHLAESVEHYWFQCIIGGASLSYFADHNLDDNGDWRVSPGETSDEILGLYREAIARSNEIIRATALDAAPKQRDGWWGDWDVPDLQFVLLHVIVETACHAGHLDAVRELIDGRQWSVLGDPTI